MLSTFCLIRIKQALYIYIYIYHRMSYETSTNTNRRNRKRKIIWYNPPFNKSLKTNIGNKFLSLVEKHFPKDHRLHKIFNKNTIKVSYSCTQNMANIIKSHNNRTLKPRNKNTHENCNCNTKEQCPLQNKFSSQTSYIKPI